MTFRETPLPGVILVELQVFRDLRGDLAETYHAERFAEAGIREHFVQDNQSSSHRGVLRGLHFQARQPQGKLVRVVRGEVFDVAVDLRLGSPHFRRWHAEVLSETNRRMVYIPPGFAHGFVTLSEEAVFLYKCTAPYAPEWDRGVRWDDPDLGVAWPVTEPVLSSKDAALPLLREISSADLELWREAEP
jgi:dTDP-4-dehydrorhamnose 3,5-epimerase